MDIPSPELGSPGHDDGVKKSSSGSRKSYSVEYKKKVVMDFHSMKPTPSIRKCADSHNISRKMLRDWIKLMPIAELVKADRAKSVRRIRHLTDPTAKQERGKWPDLDRAVHEWIMEKRKINITVDSGRIVDEAKRLALELGCGDFIGSNGWLHNFLNRFQLRCRAVTSVGQKVPANAASLCKTYFDFVDKTFAGIEVPDILNMDETPIYFDMPSNRTYDARGVKTVAAKTAGYEKLRFTVVLTIAADGKKLMPMIIFKGLVNVPKVNFPKGVHVTVAKGGSMNEDLMLEYVKSIIRTRVRSSLLQKKAILIMDSHRAHLMESVKEALRKSKTDIAIIPGGMTPLLQMLDVYINKSFKSLIKKEYQEWLENEPEDGRTKAGNRKRASYVDVANWVVRAWDAVTMELICDSFVGCGVILPRQYESLHSRLKQLIMNEDIVCDDEHTGVTDDEDENVSEVVPEDCED